MDEEGVHAPVALNGAPGEVEDDLTCPATPLGVVGTGECQPVLVDQRGPSTHAVPIPPLGGVEKCRPEERLDGGGGEEGEDSISLAAEMRGPGRPEIPDLVAPTDAGGVSGDYAPERSFSIIGGAFERRPEVKTKAVGKETVRMEAESSESVLPPVPTGPEPQGTEERATPAQGASSTGGPVPTTPGNGHRQREETRDLQGLEAGSVPEEGGDLPVPEAVKVEVLPGEHALPSESTATARAPSGQAAVEHNVAYDGRNAREVAENGPLGGIPDGDCAPSATIIATVIEPEDARPQREDRSPRLDPDIQSPSEAPESCIESEVPLGDVRERRGPAVSLEHHHESGTGDEGSHGSPSDTIKVLEVQPSDETRRVEIDGHAPEPVVMPGTAPTSTSMATGDSWIMQAGGASEGHGVPVSLEVAMQAEHPPTQERAELETARAPELLDGAAAAAAKGVSHGSEVDGIEGWAVGRGGEGMGHQENSAVGAGQDAVAACWRDVSVAKEHTTVPEDNQEEEAEEDVVMEESSLPCSGMPAVESVRLMDPFAVGEPEAGEATADLPPPESPRPRKQDILVIDVAADESIVPAGAEADAALTIEASPSDTKEATEEAPNPPVDPASNMEVMQDSPIEDSPVVSEVVPLECEEPVGVEYMEVDDAGSAASRAAESLGEGGAVAMEVTEGTSGGGDALASEVSSGECPRSAPRGFISLAIFLMVSILSYLTQATRRHLLGAHL